MPRLSLELPPGVSPERLVEVLNDRLRRIERAISGPIVLSADMDAAGYRIRNLGDPRHFLDALSQAAADRRYERRGAVESTTVEAGGAVAAATQAQALILSVPGTLSIRSDAAPLVSLPEAKTPTGVVALVKQAPAGADLTCELAVAGSEWARGTIPDGATEARLGARGPRPVSRDLRIMPAFSSVSGFVPASPSAGTTGA